MIIIDPLNLSGATSLYKYYIDAVIVHEILCFKIVLDASAKAIMIITFHFFHLVESPPLCRNRPWAKNCNLEIILLGWEVEC